MRSRRDDSECGPLPHCGPTAAHKPDTMSARGAMTAINAYCKGHLPPHTLGRKSRSEETTRPVLRTWCDATAQHRMSALLRALRVCDVVTRTVEPTFGPRGADAVVVSATNSVLLTASGAVVLAACDVQHPLARLVVGSALSYGQHCGTSLCAAVTACSLSLTRFRPRPWQAMARLDCCSALAAPCTPLPAAWEWTSTVYHGAWCLVNR